MILSLLLLGCQPQPDDDDTDTTPPAVDTTPEDEGPVDADEDGYASIATGGDDCDDTNAAIHPGAPEVWYNGVDENCNGDFDDADQDGDGARSTAFGGEDCNDRNPSLTTQENPVESRRPRPGAVDVLPDTLLEVNLTDGDPRATLEVIMNGTTVVPGELQQSARSLVFAPTGGWPPDATFEVTVRSLCAVHTHTFSTSQLGQPITDPASLVGATWRLDVRTGVVTQPPLFGALLLSSAVGVELLHATGALGDQVRLRYTYASRSATEQDVCFPALDLPRPMDLSSNPYVTLEPDATWYLGAPADPGGSVLTGIMRPDGSEILNATWSIATDLRDVYDLFRSGTAQQLCTLFASSGINCHTCPDGERVCLETRIENLELRRIDFPLALRTPEDIAADPACTP